jgi:uncharacterized protein YjbI with pentapeptide repeats
VADEELIARLKQGIDAWNAWRHQRPELSPSLAGADLSRPDLSDADLRDANLSAADLRDANLSVADLRGANLSAADLRDADLSGTSLNGANLERASLNGANLVRASLMDANLDNAALRGANLSHANLDRADLRGADLRHANLHDAVLNGANLTTAKLAETIFAALDLTSVIGLETCQHYLPSIIDHRTLRKSRSLPISFLRGVGLPENLINYLPTLFNRAIQYYSCFISYSTKDQTFADRIHADLQNKGARCWFASHDLPIGGMILDEIDAAVRLRDKLLLILSEQSIKSGWVKDEVNMAFEEERKRNQIVLFPIRVDDAVMDTNEAWAAKLRARNIGDFTRWKDHDAYKKGLERVLRDLAPKPKPS